MCSRVFRRYGTAYQSVSFEFDGNALNEVGFRRAREMSIPVDDFESGYELIETFELTSQAEGVVQSDTERLLLDRLLEKAQLAVEGLPADGLVIVEHEGGRDQPKPRQKISNVVIQGENKLRFNYHIDPPLRISSYRLKG